ncbi:MULTISPECIES: TauD/TfdA family dioxygenase [Frankia]|uniref:Uncharacterized protein n=1 Tax=Frankia alni (strain DSM 45986 / CECT 9034 / ACN14a) TaxID=326424 RepID=Q0RQ01_FRAAA|nr:MULTISPECIES: TauD/TfdA family dioxygenase [Frankia]CAJ60377.1 hypothetical protein FRAAL1725 [Frankia alni ACN14a]
MIDLRALLVTARKDGWASGLGEIDDVRNAADALDWEEIRIRRSGPPVSTLRPVETSEANPRSLSAVYGKGLQPLHTDGAHLSKPPDLVILMSEDINSTPTLLWKNPTLRETRIGTPFEALHHGMFLVQNGRDSFYAPTVEGQNCRYDPGCMTPCDSRALKVVNYFEEAQSEATAFDWSSEKKILIIDNRRTLHARSQVAEGDDGRELTRIAYRTGGDA